MLAGGILWSELLDDGVGVVEVVVSGIVGCAEGVFFGWLCLNEQTKCTVWVS